jgi:hypothetical protein
MKIFQSLLLVVVAQVIAPIASIGASKIDASRFIEGFAEDHGRMLKKTKKSKSKAPKPAPVPAPKPAPVPAPQPAPAPAPVPSPVNLACVADCYDNAADAYDAIGAACTDAKASGSSASKEIYLCTGTNVILLPTGTWPNCVNGDLVGTVTVKGCTIATMTFIAGTTSIFTATVTDTAFFSWGP